MYEEFTTIVELGYEAPGTKLEVRVVHTWMPQIRTYETWFLAVNKHGDAIQILGHNKDRGYIQSVFKLSKCYTISKYARGELDSFQEWMYTLLLGRLLQSVLSQTRARFLEIGSTSLPKNKYRTLLIAPQSLSKENVSYAINPTSLITISGPLTLLFDINKKSRGELLERTFTIKASIANMTFIDT
ncbi:unnamed protein product [Lactuca saligna]|uniref:DUF223 domain-containing protein n=1 Tax=Lactuca saligna TaxID=75948 RepID=A0AA36E9Z2_LACSI|nr:unnamed protein product [Lactuca saligna]